MSSDTPESSYPPLEKPEFKSAIPPHLLTEASPAEAHIMEELSKLSQFADWSVRAHMTTDTNVRHTNGRLRGAEANITELKDDKKSFIKGWRAIVAVTGFITGFISFAILIYQAFASH